MGHLFEPGLIGRLELPNRMIRTASHEGFADSDGNPTPEQLEFYRGFVEGGIGLIITGYMGVAPSGKSCLHHMTMLDKDENIPAHEKLVRGIHDSGGLIVAQIAHCGRQTWSRDTGLPLIAPSAIPCGFYKECPRAMTQSDIEYVVDAFGQTASRAREAGYDGVQIHSAHGYLLSSFLARRSNLRTDSWGGELKDRFNFVKAVLQSVRNAVGPDFPVLIKLNTYESCPGGITPEECIQTAELVEATNCVDAIELSCGTTEGGMVMARGDMPGQAITSYLRPYREYPAFIRTLLKYIGAPLMKLFQPSFSEGYNLATAARVKSRVSLPIITVGGMRTKSFMEEAIASGKTDFISMARPLILEPDLPNAFRDGVREAARCDNCNICVVATDAIPIRCHNERLLAEVMGK